MDEPQFSDLELQFERYMNDHSFPRSPVFCVLEFAEPGLNFPRVVLSSSEDLIAVIPIKKVPSNGLTVYEFMIREGCFDCFMFSGQTARLLGTNVRITLDSNKTNYLLVIPRAHVHHLEWIQLCQSKLRKLRERILYSEDEFKLHIVKEENHHNLSRYYHFEIEYSMNDGTKRKYTTTADQLIIRIIEKIANELQEGPGPIALFDGHIALLGPRYNVTANSRTEYTGIPIRRLAFTPELPNSETKFYLDLFVKHPDLIIYSHDDHSYPFNSLLLRGYFEFFETFMVTKVGDSSRKELKMPYQSATLDLLRRLLHDQWINYDQLDLNVITEFYFMLDFFQIRTASLIHRINQLFLELIYQKKLIPDAQQIEQLLNLPFLQSVTNKAGNQPDDFVSVREELQHITNLVNYLG